MAAPLTVMTVTEAAMFLGRSRPHVDMLIRDGKLPVMARTLGGRVFVNQKDVEAHLVLRGLTRPPRAAGRA